MKPSSFIKFPFSSVCKNIEHEIIALNVMKILKRTGDTFRKITFEEYQTERSKDGNFNMAEQQLFDKVIRYCQSAETAVLFSEEWNIPLDTEVTPSVHGFHGANLRTLIDTHISLAIIAGKDLSSYRERNEMIDEIEKRLESDEFNAVCTSNGTTFELKFKP